MKLIADKLKISLQMHGIEAEFKESEKKSKSIKSVLNANKKYLKTKNLATKESAEIFIKVLKAMNLAEKSDVLTILKEQGFQDIM